ELMSSGDTAYTALAPLTEDRYLLSWYSSDPSQELPWFEGISSPSDIWLADIDFSRAPIACTAPPPKRTCEPAPLPTPSSESQTSGQYLLTLGPVIWPSMPVFFTATVGSGAPKFDFQLQPLDAMTMAPIGAPWDPNSVRFGSNGGPTYGF